MTKDFFLKATDFNETLELVKARLSRDYIYLHYGLVDGSSRELTGLEVLKRIERLSTLYRNWGLQIGDRLFIASRNDGATITLTLSCFYYGLSAVIIDPDASWPEVDYMAKIAKPRAWCIDQALRMSWLLEPSSTVLPIEEETEKKGSLREKLLRRVKQVAQSPTMYPGILDTLEPALSPVSIPSAAEAYILFTSGTTALPRGVRISRHSLFHHGQTVSRQWRYNSGSRILDILPLHHADGLVQGAILAWCNGASCFRPLAFSVPQIGELLDSIYKYRITHFITVPTMLSLIDQYGRDYEDAFITEDFQFIVSAAGFLPEDLWTRFEERFKVRIANIYGLTETVTGSLFCGPDDETYRRGTIGRPIDCRTRVVDDRGMDVSPGSVGELLISGEHLMLGYLQDDETPLSTTNNLRWLHTGDLVNVDQDGFFRIHGRSKNIIITGGLNVQPEEVAAVIREMDEIHDACVFGLPDETFGEIVAACVEVLAEPTPSEDEIVAFCLTRLSPYKIPRMIAVVPELARGPSGKVILREVKEQLHQHYRIAAFDTSGNLDTQVIAVAARVFRVTEAALSAESGPENLVQWDSFAHITFVTELEKTFNIRLSPSDIMALRSIRDAQHTVRRITTG